MVAAGIHCIKKIKTATFILFALIFFRGNIQAANYSRPEGERGPTRVDVLIFVMDLDEVNTADQSFVAMSWTVFWIDPKEAGVQISVAITTMLTLNAYRFAVGADLPNVSYLTRLDFFIFSATILVFASLVEVVVTSTFARNRRLKMARKFDLWSRLLFPAVFASISVITLI